MRKRQQGPVNKWFRRLQPISAGFMAFSHGANDAQKTMGIIALALFASGGSPRSTIPPWVKFVCALAMALGTYSGGWRIIHTLGSKVIKLDPIHGFAAETAAASVIQVATHFGFPVSTTHTITAAIMGVGPPSGSPPCAGASPATSCSPGSSPCRRPASWPPASTSALTGHPLSPRERARLHFARTSDYHCDSATTSPRRPPPAEPRRAAAAAAASPRRSMKIRLIEPEPPGMHVWAKVLLPRLGLPIIAATLKEPRPRRAHLQPAMAPIDWDDVNSADLVGLSSTTSTASTAYEFADELRARGIPVVIGGSHVTFMADEALEHVDYVARGEGGEQLMLELVEALDGDRQLESIGGLSFTRDGVAVHNPLRDPLADLDELPFPDLRLLVGNERLKTMPIMTSWGCPFDCNFCSVTAMFGQEVPLPQRRERRRRDQGQAPAAHLLLRRQLRRRQEAAQEAPADDDRRGPRVPWSAQVRTDVVRDRELLDLMRRSGCELVYLGLESVNQETLDGSRSRRPWTTSRTASGCCTSTASAATACSCSAPTPTTCRRCATRSRSPSRTASTR